jgi:3-hydroxyacyl-[acyl-carrier-protein] dehydratase
VTHEGSGYAVTKAKITAEGKQVCDAVLTLRVLEFPNAEVAMQMRKFATRVGLALEAPADG